jgi:hypothetical protein
VSSRVRRLQASHSYGVVLALIVVSFVFAAVAPDDSWTASTLVLLQCATLVAALWTSGIARTNSRGSLAIVVLAAIVALVALVPGGRAGMVVAGLFAGALTVAIVVVIARGVLDQNEVNQQSVRGAIAVYLLLGLIFVFIYGVVAILGSHPFFVQGSSGTRAVRVYFSYVTLATLGYGDYTPAGTVGHMLAVVEALIGQLYLVTVVAVLVSRLGRRKSVEEGDDQGRFIPRG